MAVNIDMYEDTGAVTSGRGATVSLITDWNLKDSADPAYVYYPTLETSSAPLTRPTLPGQEVFSYKKYISFQINGTYTRIKNLNIGLSILGSPQADKTRLFYKFTNTYAVPDKAYDGDMMCAALNSSVQKPVLIPFWSTSNPQSATTRAVSYGPNQTLYSNWICVQLRTPFESTVGNSPEFKLTLNVTEY